MFGPTVATSAHVPAPEHAPDFLYTWNPFSLLLLSVQVSFIFPGVDSAAALRFAGPYGTIAVVEAGDEPDALIAFT
jgi:hypothetical protein